MTSKEILKIVAFALPAMALLVGTSVYADTATRGRGNFPELTDEQKAIMEQVRELHQAGKFDEAKALIESSDLPMPMGPKGDRPEMDGHREEVRQAIEDNDFETFKELTADAPFADKVTEANFAKMVEAHQLMEDGDHEAARAIMEEIGFPGPHGHGPRGEGRFDDSSDN